ncbi:MAG TPA: Yip1 family protein [Candidatus Methanoperedens sp.]
MNQIDRAIGILKSPQTELVKVKSEQINKIDIIRQYIAILALIPAVAYIIGMGFVGINVGFVSIKYPIQNAIIGGIFTYILSIVEVYILGFVINALAPNFASKQNEDQAMKLAAYAATAPLVGGIFNIIPMLSFISLIFVLYGFYILYLGIPILMETPQANTIAYTIIIIVVTVIISIVIGAFVEAVMAAINPVPNMMSSIPYR